MLSFTVLVNIALSSLEQSLWLGHSASPVPWFSLSLMAFNVASSAMVVGETGTAVCACTDDDLFSSSNFGESALSTSSLI